MKQFSGSSKWLKGLDGDKVGRLLSLASDVALIVSDSNQGIIRDVSVGSDLIPIDLAEKWIGRPWQETVTVETRQKVEALLRDSADRSKGPPRWRLVNHSGSGGADVPVLYTSAQIADGRVVAFGRSMQPMAALQQQLVSTQQSIEREYLKQRQMEARHRLLFQVASEAVLIVDVQTRKIVEANPAAGRLLGEGTKRLIGRLFPEGFDEPSTQALHALLGAVRATGRTDDVNVSFAEGAAEFVASAPL